MWGVDGQPVPLSAVVWINVLLRREELEYGVPGDAEPYTAAKVNRFRASWHVLHLLHSFWRVTETTRSVHTYLKTLGAFGMARAAVDIKPEMLDQSMLQSQREGKAPPLHRLQTDKCGKL